MFLVRSRYRQKATYILLQRQEAVLFTFSTCKAMNEFCLVVCYEQFVKRRNWGWCKIKSWKFARKIRRKPRKKSCSERAKEPLTEFVRPTRTRTSFSTKRLKRLSKQSNLRSFDTQPKIWLQSSLLFPRRPIFNRE